MDGYVESLEQPLAVAEIVSSDTFQVVSLAIHHSTAEGSNNPNNSVENDIHIHIPDYCGMLMPILNDFHPYRH